MREDIERALWGLFYHIILRHMIASQEAPCSDDIMAEELLFDLRDALAESKDVIVIEAEVEHSTWYGKDTWIKTKKSPCYGQINILGGHHGTPGSYLFFGVPKPKENRKP